MDGVRTSLFGYLVCGGGVVAMVDVLMVCAEDNVLVCAVVSLSSLPESSNELRSRDGGDGKSLDLTVDWSKHFGATGSVLERDESGRDVDENLGNSVEAAVTNVSRGHRHTDTHRHTQTQTQVHHRHTHRLTDLQTYRVTDTQTQTHRHTWN